MHLLSHLIILYNGKPLIILGTNPGGADVLESRLDIHWIQERIGQQYHLSSRPERPIISNY